MEHTNQANDVQPVSDVDRFYILMGPLYGVVDPEGSIKLTECATPDELRREIAVRATNVKSVLKKPGPNQSRAMQPGQKRNVFKRSIIRVRCC